MVLRSSVDSTPFRTNTKSREVLFSSCTHCNASYKRVARITCGKCQGEFIGYFLNVFWVNNIYDVHTFMSLMWRYSSMMDLDFLSSSFLAQGGFGLNRGWWSRSRHWLHWETQAGKGWINLGLIKSKICTAPLFKTFNSYLSPCFYHALDCLDRGYLSCWTHGVQNLVAHGCRFCAHHFHDWSCVWWWPDEVCRGLGLPAYYRIGQSDPGLGHRDLYRYGPYWSCSCTADA